MIMALPSLAASPEARPSWVGRIGLAGDWAKQFYFRQKYYAFTSATNPAPSQVSSHGGCEGKMAPKIAVEQPYSSLYNRATTAGVAELADAQDLGSCGRKAVGVQIPPSALPFVCFREKHSISLILLRL